jgi:hypothetical protein
MLREKGGVEFDLCVSLFETEAFCLVEETTALRSSTSLAFSSGIALRSSSSFAFSSGMLGCFNDAKENRSSRNQDDAVADSFASF